ncbi:MAG: CBS domain-containing protein [Candidatus Hydrothermarchaeota archaeon]|jgi:CBS domain-containing protein|nr:CBS domain-containing protein [Candidatus Hydrothermarchaeota archaeon]
MRKAKDVMIKNVKTISPSATMAEAAKAMKKNRIGSLVIVKGNRPVGIITERDLAYKIIAEEQSLDMKVREVMTKDLKTVQPEKSIKDAARLMAAHVIRRLPVVEGGKLVGIITIEDIMRIEKVGEDTSIYSYT